MGNVKRKLMRLGRDDSCATCGIDCPSGAQAWWFKEERVVRCRPCVEGAEVARSLAGTPGASASREGERRHERRQEQLRARFGRLAPLVDHVTDDPQSTRSWIKGGASEKGVGEYLDAELDGKALVLHDRRVPGSRANIDHVAVARSGIWVIDSKSREGRVKWRDVGPLWRTELRLVVNGRDGTKLITAMKGQVDIVAKALGGRATELPIRAALCFNGADWGLLGRSFWIDNVLVTYPGDLVQHIRKDGPLDDQTVHWVAGSLALDLPA